MNSDTITELRRLAAAQQIVCHPLNRPKLAPTQAQPQAQPSMLSLKVPAADREAVREMGAHERYPGKKNSNDWQVIDTPENRERFMPWLGREPSAYNKFISANMNDQHIKARFPKVTDRMRHAASLWKSRNA